MSMTDEQLAEGQKRHKWWEAYLTALAGFSRNPSDAIPRNVSKLAHEHADDAVNAFYRKWPSP